MLMEAKFLAPDIECVGCATSIQKALGWQTGVETVHVDVPTQRVTIVYDGAQTSASALAKMLTEIGFPPELGTV